MQFSREIFHIHLSFIHCTLLVNHLHIGSSLDMDIFALGWENIISTLEKPFGIITEGLY